MFCGEKVANKNTNIFDHFLQTILIYRSAWEADEKNIKEDRQTLAELSSAYGRSQAKGQSPTKLNQLYVILNGLNCSCLPYKKKTSY